MDLNKNHHHHNQSQLWNFHPNSRNFWILCYQKYVESDVCYDDCNYFKIRFLFNNVLNSIYFVLEVIEFGDELYQMSLQTVTLNNAGKPLKLSMVIWV